MRRLALLAALVVVVWSVAQAVVPQVAVACSCAGPPSLVAFEGTAETESPSGEIAETESLSSGIFERDHEFKVDKVISGDVQESETVRVFTSYGASCGIGQRLLAKGRYRISASISALPEGNRLLFVTSCGGSAELLAPPSGFTTSSTERVVVPSTEALPARSHQKGEPSRWPIVVGVLAVAGIGALFLRHRGRP